MNSLAPMRSPNTITPALFVSLSAKSPAMVSSQTCAPSARMARSATNPGKKQRGCRKKIFILTKVKWEAKEIEALTPDHNSE